MMKFIKNSPNQRFIWSTVDLSRLTGEYVGDLLKIKFDSK